MMKKLFVMGFFMAVVMMISMGNLFARTEEKNTAGTKDLTVVQTDTVKHVVKQGETLGAIAEQYGTTEEEIIKLNPEVAHTIYIGMELVIPVVKVKNKAVANEQKRVSKPRVAEVKEDVPKAEKTSRRVAEYRKWTGRGYIGFGFPSFPEEMDGSFFTYAITVGGDYNVARSFYVGARLGYNSSTINVDSPMDITQKFHFITLPLETGFRLFLLPDKVALIPHVGFEMNFAVKGTTEGDGWGKEKLDVGGDVGMAVNLGVDLRLWDFLIRGAYVLPLNDKQKSFFGEDAYPAISIGFVF